MFSHLLTFLLPVLCTVCRDTDPGGTGLCSDCAETLPWQPPGCQQCGIELGRTADQPWCEHCLATPPAFDSCHASFDYCTPVTELISRFKFAGGLAEGRVLGQVLAQAFRAHYEPGAEPQLLIPVPVHHSRLRRRGFNQSIELARAIGRFCNVPVRTDVCIRPEQGRPQRGLPARQRVSNISNAFRLKTRHGLDRFSRLAIIDDVVTTTATVNAVATTLRRGNRAAQIDVWALARVN